MNSNSELKKFKDKPHLKFKIIDENHDLIEILNQKLGTRNLLTEPLKQPFFTEQFPNLEKDSSILDLAMSINIYFEFVLFETGLEFAKMLKEFYRTNFEESIIKMKKSLSMQYISLHNIICLNQNGLF